MQFTESVPPRRLLGWKERLFISRKENSKDQKPVAQSVESFHNRPLDDNSFLSLALQMEVKSEAQYNDCGMTRSDAIMILIFLMI
jgi:hypothetical protein